MTLKGAYSLKKTHFYQLKLLIFCNRLKDILLLVKDVKMILPKEDMQQISLKEAVERAFKKPADLTGYLVLSDGILSLIMHAPVEAAGNKKQQEDLKKVNEDSVAVTCLQGN